MARLLLLRHAKSSWADPGLRDHDRPLNGRGRDAASRMGDELRARGLVPEVVLCSSSRRTCETVALLGLPATTALEISHDLYLADAGEVAAPLRGIGSDVSIAMVVGHNPTMQEVALDLAGSGDGGALDRLGTKYPTGALAVLRFDGPWSDLRSGTGHLEAFVTPGDLG